MTEAVEHQSTMTLNHSARSQLDAPSASFRHGSAEVQGWGRGPEHEYDLVFPSEEWTLRDPGNVGHQWQRVRTALGIPDDITAHSFRGAVATILDDAGISARIAADVFGHSDPAMTQRRYMARGRVHTAAAALDDAVGGLTWNEFVGN